MPTRTRIFVSFAVALPLWVAAAGIPVHVVAQSESIQLPPQTKVRITAPTLARTHIVGTIVETTTESWAVAVQGEDSTLVVPVASVRYLEVSRGSRRRVVRGLAIGLVAGAAVGAYLCLRTSFDDDCAWLSFGRAGAAVGGLVGLIPVDRWEEVPLDRPTLGVGPARGGGIALTATLRP